jgi:hypothetical protein
MFLQSAFKGCGMKISTLGLKQDILRANFIPENGLLTGRYYININKIAWSLSASDKRLLADGYAKRWGSRK